VPYLTWTLLRWWFTTKRRYIKCMDLYIYLYFCWLITTIHWPVKLFGGLASWRRVGVDHALASIPQEWAQKGQVLWSKRDTNMDVLPKVLLVVCISAGKKKQMYAMFVVCTGMLYFAKNFFEIVRLCCRTIFNEII